MANSGHSIQTIEHYAKRVNQKRLAEQAIQKLIENEI